MLARVRPEIGSTRNPALIARTFSRWGHLILPIVLVGFGLTILVEGGAFGL
ncbi:MULTISPECIES: hypothetical protein [unclassified Micromonospora]|uniref:hypothetical protein n=1 Tax=unclassified Micromonospora TaxID=2617518 RepID=UPI002FF3852A